MAWVSVDFGNGKTAGQPQHRVVSCYGGAASEWRADEMGLTLRSDPLGIAAIYYYATAKRVICADNLVELFENGAPRKVDPLLLRFNERFFFCPLDLTIFEGIKRLPPGATLTFNASGDMRVSNGIKAPRAHTLSRGAAVATYGGLFEDAVRKLTQGEDALTVPLSGGRDSRHILLACRALKKDIRAVTFRNFPPTGRDVAIAAEVCRAIGCAHEVIENTEYDFLPSLVKTLPAVHFETIHHGWIWALVRYLKEKPRPFLDGLAGDVLSNALFFSARDNHLIRDGRGEELARELALTVRPNPDKQNAARDLERTEHLIATEFARWADWPNPQIACTLFNRTRRCIASAPRAISAASGAPAVFPYLEPDLFAFLAGLNEGFFADKGFHDEAIALRYPGGAAIPYGQDQARARLGYFVSLRNALPYLYGWQSAGGLEPDRLVQLAGIAKVMAGADFAQQSWRFTSHALTLAIAKGPPRSGSRTRG